MNTSKVLIVGHEMYVGYFQSLTAAFEQNQCSCLVFQHKLTSAKKIVETKGLRRIKNRLVIQGLNKKLLREADAFQPDYVFLVNGEILLEETVKQLNRKSTVVLWLIDGVDNVNILRSVLDCIRHVFVFEPADLKKIPGSKYLPQCADATIYKKVAAEMKYDVSFVGAGHEKRIGMLNDIALFCEERGYSLGVFGQYKTFFKKPPAERRKYAYLEKRIFENRKLIPSEVNEIFNSSRINLNIHHEQSEYGLNPRVFEIMATENFQLIDDQRELHAFFEEGISVATYKNMDDLKAKIQYFLEHEKERGLIAQNGYERVMRDHLYRNRMKTVLENVAASMETYRATPQTPDERDSQRS